MCRHTVANKCDSYLEVWPQGGKRWIVLRYIPQLLLEKPAPSSEPVVARSIDQLQKDDTGFARRVAGWQCITLMAECFMAHLMRQSTSRSNSSFALACDTEIICGKSISVTSSSSSTCATGVNSCWSRSKPSSSPA